MLLKAINVTPYQLRTAPLVKLWKPMVTMWLKNHSLSYIKHILLTLSCINFLPLTGQPDFSDSYIFTNQILNEKIKSVQLYKEGWNLSYPSIKLNSNEKLLLHFDLLEEQPEPYYYTFIHCDKDWKKSDIFSNDFLEGYYENPIEDYEASFNTTVSYYHYRLSFPNDRITLKLSGNYTLIIYPFNKPEDPVLTQRFIVTEDAVKIDVIIHRPQMTNNYNTHQQVDFTVNYSGLNVIDPYRNIFAYVLQNGRWDNNKRDLKPDIYGNNELKYNSLSDKDIFPGGNEYRYFDIKSIKYQTEKVKRIDFVVPNYNIYLYPSESREFKPYFYMQDFNGKYYIAIQEGRNSDIDADYVYVYFTLPSREKIPGGNIYVAGSLNNWMFDKNNIMSYNQERAEYECTMLLKQGWYNYEYVFLKDGDTDGTATIFEGSHFETENDYTILIYYRNPRDRYDRVIGSVNYNTLNRLSD
jgi:virulence-associated protein VagC